MTFTRLLKGARPTVQATAHMMGTICYNNKDALMAGMICAGWDPVEGGTLYAIPLGGACVKMPFAIGGSGSTYIYGHVDEAYRPGMTRDECIAFVSTGRLWADGCVCACVLRSYACLLWVDLVVLGAECELGWCMCARVCGVCLCQLFPTPWPGTGRRVASFVWW